MKGQFNIEYLVSLAVFIVILVFVSSQVAQVVPRLHSDSVSSRLDAKAYRITDILIKTEGVRNGGTSDWESDPIDPVIVGLSSDEPYVLYSSKISSFNSLCIDPNGYNKIRDIFGLEPGSDFQITIVAGEEIVMDCGQRAPANAIRTVVRRYAITTAGESVDLVFSMW